MSVLGARLEMVGSNWTKAEGGIVDKNGSSYEDPGKWDSPFVYRGKETNCTPHTEEGRQKKAESMANCNCRPSLVWSWLARTGRLIGRNR